MAERPDGPDEETALVDRRLDATQRVEPVDERTRRADRLAPLDAAPAGPPPSRAPADMPLHRYGVRRDPLTVPVTRTAPPTAGPGPAPRRPRRPRRTGALFAVSAVLLMLAALIAAGIALYLLVTG